MDLGRRELLIAAGSAAVVGCAGRERIDGPSEWAQYNGSPAHTGTGLGEIPQSPPSVVERIRLETTATSPVGTASTLAVGDETGVIVVSRDDLGTTRIRTPGRRPRVPVLADGAVYATAVGADRSAVVLRAATGGEITWEASLAVGTASGPAVADGTVYVSDTDGHHALDAETGDHVWRTGDGYQTTAGTLTTENVVPAVGSETVVFVTETGLAGVERESGQRLWTVPVGRVVSAPTVTDGTVYVPAVEQGLVALDATTGERLWTWETTPCWATPAVTDDRVYAAGGVRPVALDAETGDQRWRGPSLGGAVSAGLVNVGDTVLTGSHGAGITAVDDDGTKRWTVTDGASFHAPLCIDSLVVSVQYTDDRPELRLLRFGES